MKLLADAPPVTAFGILIVAAVMVLLGLVDKIRLKQKRRD